MLATAIIGGVQVQTPKIPDGIYSTTAMVTYLDYDMDIVTVSTMTGIKYQFDNCDDWCVGDFCSMTMYDNNTADIHDDEVLDYRYSGYVEGWEWIELEAVEHIYE